MKIVKNDDTVGFVIFSGMEHGTQSGYSFKYQAKSYQPQAFFASEGCDIFQ